MDSCRRPIGGRRTVNRRGVDPSDLICLRTRMETVEADLRQALRISSTISDRLVFSHPLYSRASAVVTYTRVMRTIIGFMSAIGTKRI